MRVINKIKVQGVIPESIADEIGLRKGDLIVSINQEEIIDILDYKFQIADEYIELAIEHENGELEIYEIEKEAGEDLGIQFESELIDKPHSCRNNCIFCFMGQLPPHVRKTLLFKDDDYRLSFFTGNYITMTNMKQEDIDRIIKYRLSPVNISVHATDQEVRCKMLNNRYAGKVLSYIEKLYHAKISMNTQIVLCKGINDGKILEKTLADLSKYTPYVQSICIVPVGLTKYRENKFPLEPIGKEDSIETIHIVEKYQKLFQEKYHSNLVFLADEFYYKAGIKIPDYDSYEDFPQLENGVGMTAIFDHDFAKEMKKLQNKVSKNQEKYENIEKVVTVVTGTITKEYIQEKVNEIQKLIPHLKVNVVAIKNHFFGESITVTGLITGKDIIEQVGKLENIGEYIVIPNVCLKEDVDIFLDDTPLTQIPEETKTKVVVSNTTAKGFIETLLLDSRKIKRNIYHCHVEENTKNPYEM